MRITLFKKLKELRRRSNMEKRSSKESLASQSSSSTVSSPSEPSPSFTNPSSNPTESVDTLHNRLLENHDTLMKMNSEKRLIDQQRKGLMDKACDLLRDYKKIEARLEDDSLAYSKAWHQEFAHSICMKLPREIRDMIYDHLIMPRWLIEIKKDNNSDWQKKKMNFPRDAHFLQSAYIGQQVAHELSERIYRISTFEVRNLTIAGWLMRCDIFDSGVFPRHAIRNLRIRIFPDDQTTDLITEAPTLEPKQVGYLERVLGVRNPEGFKLTFLLVAKEAKVKPMLLSLATFVYRASKLGFRVKVFQYASPPRFDMGTKFKERNVYDLTELFSEVDPQKCRQRLLDFNHLDDIGVKKKASIALGQPN